MAPVRRLIEEPRKALLNEAKGLISQSEQLLSLGVGNSKLTDQNISDLRSQRDVLQHLLAEAPDDQAAIRQAVNDLGKTTTGAKNILDEKSPLDAEQDSTS